MKNELMGVVESLDVSSLPTAINAATPIVVSEYRLAQNYPNPFNPNTVIGYQLPVKSYVTIKVYDMLGREAATLVNETKDAGIYEAKFDASMLTSGVYLYKLCAGDYSQTRKLLLLK
jgi:hypothetical protein